MDKNQFFLKKLLLRLTNEQPSRTFNYLWVTTNYLIGNKKIYFIVEVLII